MSLLTVLDVDHLIWEILYALAAVAGGVWFLLRPGQKAGRERIKFADDDLLLWLVGAAVVGGLLYLLGLGIAALPVSVAIIIGAIIIAGAR